MSSKFSEALAKIVGCNQSWDGAFQGGKFILFSGAVPALPETVVLDSQVIMEITQNDGAWTGETIGTATVTLTAIASPNTIQIKVGGVPLHSTFTAGSSNTTTEATALALKINQSPFNLGIRATSNSNVVTLHAPFGVGTGFNGVVLSNAGSGGTVGLANFASGVAAVNGLGWAPDVTVPNKLIKASGEIWSGTCPVGITSQVACTFFRYVVDAGDNGYSDDTASKLLRRWQGTVGGNTSTTADLKFPFTTTNLIADVQLGINSYSFTIPKI